MADGKVLEFSGVTKVFGDVSAVSELTARVEPGVVTAVLGPNGAGKTTSLRILLGEIRPSSGTATIGGSTYSRISHPARTVGAVLETPVFRPRRTATRQLTSVAKSNGIPVTRVREVLDLVGLSDVADMRIGSYSLGMRQRLSIAQALLGDPGVLVFDEPVNGMDPEGIRWMRLLMRRLADEGRTVLMSSHLLSEVQQIADRILIISNGRLVFTGDISELADVDPIVLVDSADRPALTKALRENGYEFEVLRSGINVRDARAKVLGEVAAKAGIALSVLHQRGASLEDVFLDLVNGRPTRQTAALPQNDAAPEAAAVSDEALAENAPDDAVADEQVADVPDEQAADDADGAVADGPAPSGAGAFGAATIGGGVAAAGIAGAAFAGSDGSDDDADAEAAHEDDTDNTGDASDADDASSDDANAGDDAEADAATGFSEAAEAAGVSDDADASDTGDETAHADDAGATDGSDDDSDVADATDGGDTDEPGDAEENADAEAAAFAVAGDEDHHDGDAGSDEFASSGDAADSTPTDEAQQGDESVADENTGTGTDEDSSAPEDADQQDGESETTDDAAGSEANADEADDSDAADQQNDESETSDGAIDTEPYGDESTGAESHDPGAVELQGGEFETAEDADDPETNADENADAGSDVDENADENGRADDADEQPADADASDTGDTTGQGAADTAQGSYDAGGTYTYSTADGFDDGDVETNAIPVVAQPGLSYGTPAPADAQDSDSAPAGERAEYDRADEEIDAEAPSFEVPVATASIDAQVDETTDADADEQPGAEQPADQSDADDESEPAAEPQTRLPGSAALAGLLSGDEDAVRAIPTFPLLGAPEREGAPGEAAEADGAEQSPWSTGPSFAERFGTPAPASDDAAAPDDAEQANDGEQQSDAENAAAEHSYTEQAETEQPGAGQPEAEQSDPDQSDEAPAEPDTTTQEMSFDEFASAFGSEDDDAEGDDDRN